MSTRSDLDLNGTSLYSMGSDVSWRTDTVSSGGNTYEIGMVYEISLASTTFLHLVKVVAQLHSGITSQALCHITIAERDVSGGTTTLLPSPSISSLSSLPIVSGSRFDFTFQGNDITADKQIYNRHNYLLEANKRYFVILTMPIVSSFNNLAGSTTYPSIGTDIGITVPAIYRVLYSVTGKTYGDSTAANIGHSVSPHYSNK